MGTDSCDCQEERSFFLDYRICTELLCSREHTIFWLPRATTMMSNTFLFCLVFAINIQGIFLLPNSRPWHWERVYDEKAQLRVGKPVVQNDGLVADKTKDTPAVVKPVAVLSEKVKDIAKEDEKVKKDTPAQIMVPKSMVVRRRGHFKRGIPEAGPKNYIYKLTPAQIDDCVKDTNMWRSKHVDTPNMEWDAELAKGAEQWAQHVLYMKMKNYEHCQGPNWKDPICDWFQHAPNEVRGKYEGDAVGENMWNIWMDTINYIPFQCKDANKSWYDEIKDYDFKNPKFSHETGHFTQLVWKGTRRFGVGVAFVDYDDDYEYWHMTVIVARYAPMGNVEGTFAENVGNLK